MAINWISSGAFTSGTGALTVPVAAGYAAGDVFLLFVNSANQAVATPAGGWTEVANSPQSTGTAAAAGGVLIAAFWKICGASESSVSVADTGSYTTAEIHLFKGCDTTNPIHITAGSVQASAATAWTLPSVTTTINDTLVVLAIGLDRDLGSTTTVSGWTNANLGTITEQSDTTVNAGAGGGLGIATADYPTAGTTGTTEVTAATSTTAAFLTIALRGKVLLETSGTSVSTALAALTTVPVGAELVSSKTGVDTVTLDSWVEAGDLAICMAFNEAGTTVPSLPPGGLGTAVAGTMSSSASWRELAFGAGVFVALSQTSTVAATSTDGITWTARTLPTASYWMDIVYGGGIFFAVTGNGSVAASSTDGATWTQRTMPSSSDWRAVAYGNGIFVAVAGNPSSIAASSSDGITWTARSMPLSASWWVAAYGSGTFVSIAGNDLTTTAASSTNGITWTARTMPTSSQWTSVTYGNGVFVAVSSVASNAAATSSDGITWTARTLPTSSNWNDVTYDDGVFVAVATATSNAAYSIDGVTWYTYTMPSSGSWTAVQYGNNVFVAVIQSSTASTTIPVTAAPTSHDASSGTAVASRLASKVLTAGGVQTIGPFTGATSVACSVYRNVDPAAPIGNVVVAGGTGTAVTLPAVTTNVGDFAVCFAGHQSTDVVFPATGTGVVRRAQEIDATDAIAVYDSAGAVP
jgi:hypothetical protein